MFFDDPATAFGNLRTALRRGRLAFLCWRTRDENPFFTFGFAAAAAPLGLRETPGPDAAFSLADTGRVGELLSGAGFGGIEFRFTRAVLQGSAVYALQAFWHGAGQWPAAVMRMVKTAI
jgi:hypothetical protein